MPYEISVRGFCVRRLQIQRSAKKMRMGCTKKSVLPIRIFFYWRQQILPYRAKFTLLG